MDISNTPKKSLGQHWLFDIDALDAMADAASVQKGDHVLEIGPGLGTLTQILLERGAIVTAVELDTELFNKLTKRDFGLLTQNLRLVNEDALKFDLTTMPTGYKIVANIPYYLTSNLIRLISETTNPPSKAAVLIQKEVAERAAAQPGKLSILGVTAQYFWEVSLGRTVSSDLFEPPPKVDSQILILKRRSGPLFNDVSTRAYFRVVKAGFSQKRKTILNSLSGGLALDKVSIKAACAKANIDPGRRAQTLTLEEWHELALALDT